MCCGPAPATMVNAALVHLGEALGQAAGDEVHIAARPRVQHHQVPNLPAPQAATSGAKDYRRAGRQSTGAASPAGRPRCTPDHAAAIHRCGPHRDVVADDHVASCRQMLHAVPLHPDAQQLVEHCSRPAAAVAVQHGVGQCSRPAGRWVSLACRSLEDDLQHLGSSCRCSSAMQSPAQAAPPTSPCVVRPIHSLRMQQP